MAGANSLADTCAINLVLQGLVCSAFWSTDWAWLLKYLLSYISAAWQAGKIAVCWYVRNMVGCLHPLWLWQWTQWLSFRREELLVMQCLSIWMIFGVLCYPTEIGLILTTCDRTRQNDHSRHHNPRSISHTLAPQFFFYLAYYCSPLILLGIAVIISLEDDVLSCTLPLFLSLKMNLQVTASPWCALLVPIALLWWKVVVLM